MRLHLVTYAIATAGAFATSSVAARQGLATWVCPVVERKCNECRYKCQNGPNGFVNSSKSPEFVDCVAKFCGVTAKGRNDCHRLNHATACVMKRCPAGAYSDYLDVVCNWRECRCA